MNTGFKEKYGDYAMIVGASAGIGEAFARELASRGLHLVLVARRPDRLQRLALELHQQYHVDVKCIGVDLMEDGAAEKLAHATVALAFELAPSGVDVLVVAPGATETDGMRKTANIDYSKIKGISVMAPADVAREGIDGLGRTTYLIPGAKNRFSALILGLLPQSTVVKTIGKMMSTAVDRDAL